MSQRLSRQRVHGADLGGSELRLPTDTRSPSVSQQGKQATPGCLLFAAVAANPLGRSSDRVLEWWFQPFRTVFTRSLCNGLVRNLGPQKFHFGKSGTLPFQILALVNDVPLWRKGKLSWAELASSCHLQWLATTGSQQDLPQWVLSIRSQLLQSCIQEAFSFLLKPNVSSLPF